MTYRIISETHPVANRQHQCIWCSEPIGAGERYVRECFRLDGALKFRQWHPECAEACLAQPAGAPLVSHANARPLSDAMREYASWDCALLVERDVMQVSRP